MEALPKLSPSELVSSRQPTLYGVEITLVILIFVVFALRLLSRWLTRQKLWWDDYLCIAALVFAIGQAASEFIAIKAGTGRHVQVLTPADVMLALKGTKAGEYCYILLIGSTKLSVLFFFWRIFSVYSTFRIPFFILFIVIVLWMLACFIVICAECTPYRAFWDRSAGTCISSAKFFLALTIPNIITDGFLWFLPMPYIFSLSLSPGRKLGLLLAFGLGSFVMIMSGLRIWATLRFQYSVDITWDDTDVVLYSFLECNTAFICASLPPIAPLFRITYLKATGRESTARTPPPKPWPGNRSWDKTYSSNENSGKPSTIGSKSNRVFGFTKLWDPSTNASAPTRTSQDDTHELTNIHIGHT